MPESSYWFYKFERLLIRYVQAGQKLFTINCLHFVEVNFMRQDLMMMYRRNLGSLPQNTLAGLLWDIIADTAQYFSTYNSTKDFTATSQRNIPMSFLGTKRSLLSMNQRSATAYTKYWLMVLTPHGGGRHQGLGKSRQELEYDRDRQ